jgi:MFS family permease
MTGLGPNYGKLLAASTVSNLGDGVRLAALPLLAASLTRDPELVAGVRVATTVPWLLLALVAGVVVDRVDRRRLLQVANGRLYAAEEVANRLAGPPLGSLLFVAAAAAPSCSTRPASRSRRSSSSW